MIARSADTLGGLTIRTLIRRRWPLAAALLALLASGGAMLGSGSTAAIAEILKDPLSLLAERSPGARADGSQFAAKRGKGVTPVQFVMGTGRERAPTVSEAAAPAGASPASAPDSLVALLPEEPLVAGVPDGLLPGDATPGALQGPSLGVGNPGMLIPIGSGPGGPGSSPGCCTSGTPPGGTVPPAVPEPATWVTLILGFFMVGGVLRAKPKHSTGRRTA